MKEGKLHIEEQLTSTPKPIQFVVTVDGKLTATLSYEDVRYALAVYDQKMAAYKTVYRLE